MSEKIMPVIFVGHGSPMMALEKNDISKKFKEVGDEVIEKFGRPKAILCISAHWFTRGSYTNTQEKPEQVYDMYGFPEELYKVKYPVNGNAELANKLREMKGINIDINNDWGIDHGTWTVMVHMFPNADIPIVQLSVDASLSEEEIYKLGQEISQLREDGYLIIGSGNVVHNLRLVEWDNKGGSREADEFDKFIKNSIVEKNYDNLINYKRHRLASYAVPTPDHYLPLLYILGASRDQKASVFNEVRSLGAISMTSYAFGLED